MAEEIEKNKMEEKLDISNSNHGIGLLNFLEW